jgi:hypothetical protein
MTDPETGFRALRNTRVPDVWEEVERRASEGRRPPVSWNRYVGAVVALALAAAGVLVAIETFDRRQPDRRPADTIPGVPQGWTELPSPPGDLHDGAAFVWTGLEVLAWGGCGGEVTDGCGMAERGYAFDPERRSWHPLPPIDAPSSSNAVWTGREAIFFENEPEGSPVPGATLSARAYDPAARTWRSLPEAPLQARTGAVHLWTGDEVVVWGGGDQRDAGSSLGAAYDPGTNSWRRIREAPHGLNLFSGVWTGREMIVFGSLLNERNVADTRTAVGAAYDPETDAWRTLPPSELSPQATAAAWVGDRMVAYDYETTWQAYDPEGDTWTEPADTPFPFDECYPDAARAGDLGFAFFCGRAALYDPSALAWERIRGGPLDDEIERQGGLRLWRFASLVPAGDGLFLSMEGITVTGEDETPCFGCPGSPRSFWAYRPGTTTPPA